MLKKEKRKFRNDSRNAGTKTCAAYPKFPLDSETKNKLSRKSEPLQDGKLERQSGMK